MGKNVKPRSKFPALVTYVVAVIALAAGLVLPLHSLTLGTFDFKNSGMFEIGGAVQTLFNMEKPLFGNGLNLWSWPLTVVNGFTLDIGAILLLLYALITVVSLIMVIPVCATKKVDEPAKLKALKIASVMEVIALFVLSICLIRNAFVAPLIGWNLSLVIAFGVTLLMLILQSIVYKGGSGVIKTVLFVLSAIAVFFTMINGAALIPGLSGGIASINGALHTADGLYSGVYGWEFILGVFFLSTVFAASWAHILFYFIMLLLVLMVFINFFLDLAGLGKITTRGLLICNIVRDCITIAALVGALIMIFSLFYTFGIMFILLCVVVLAQTIINIVRLATFAKSNKESEEKEPKAKKIIEEGAPAPAPAAAAYSATPATSETPQYEPAYAQSEPMPSLDNLFGQIEPKEPTPAENESYEEQLTMPLGDIPESTRTTTEDGTVVETKNVVYKVNTIYDGPTDGFIKKLSNDEKVEFARNFLGVRQPKLQVLPEYVVGGNNEKFFSSVFIYLAKIRDLVSDGLMNKFYDEVNMMQ